MQAGASFLNQLLCQKQNFHHDRWINETPNHHPRDIKHSRDKPTQSRIHGILRCRGLVNDTSKDQKPSVDFHRQDNPHQPSILRPLIRNNEQNHGNGMVLRGEKVVRFTGITPCLFHASDTYLDDHIRTLDANRHACNPTEVGKEVESCGLSYTSKRSKHEWSVPMAGLKCFVQHKHFTYQEIGQITGPSVSKVVKTG